MTANNNSAPLRLCVKFFLINHIRVVCGKKGTIK